MNDLDTLMDEYLLTLEHDVEDRHYDEEWTSEREDAHAVLEAFMHWVHREKQARIIYRQPHIYEDGKLTNFAARKKAWMVVYGDESRSRLFDYETDAKQWASYVSDSKVVKVTWEE